jgi:TPR repeat protein
VTACGNLAFLLVRRGELALDDDEPRRLYERAWTQGAASGCLAKGYALYDGRGTRVDHPGALVAWERGCELGDGIACGNAGAMISKGEGAPDDRERAVKLYARGCSLEGPDACLFLARVARERGDDGKARALLRKACTLGSEAACNDEQGADPVAPTR